MTLSCSCDYEPEPGDVCWEETGYAPLDTKRSRACRSCGVRIIPESLALRFRRWKAPEHDLELEIYGEDWDSGPPRATHYLCEECGDIYLSLAELGFCFPYAETRSALDDYREMAEAQRQEVTA